MEDLVMMDAFTGAYRGKRVFVTGHTGFKGAWLVEWLLGMGAEVTGFSDKVADGPTLFAGLGHEAQITHVIGDVRDEVAVKTALHAAKPDFVFHLAAQSLVRYSYYAPVETMATNVLGVAHVLEALRSISHPAACLIVTSDKCYENREVLTGYREDDAMGGHDPYSASKGAAEIVAQAYRRSFFSGADSAVHMATARAGNVIGGGDWSADRIVPDCVRSLERAEPIQVRNPHATRPWQHVLEPLSGYLWLAAVLAGGASTARAPTPETVCDGFNFGPWTESNASVRRLVEEMLRHWDGAWRDASAPGQPHEATLLNLSIDKAFHTLDWAPALDFQQSVAMTATWYKSVLTEGASAVDRTRQDISDYVARARTRGLAWAGDGS